jgi:hypothetical protein
MILRNEKLIYYYFVNNYSNDKATAGRARREARGSSLAPHFPIK